MQIEFRCSCGARMLTAAENRGKKAKCSKCEKVVVIEPAPQSIKPTTASPRQQTTSSPKTPQANQQVRRPATKPAQRPAPTVHAPTPAAASFPELDPLADLSFPSAPYPGAPSAGPAWANNPIPNAYAPVRRKKASPWLWIGLGVGAAGLLMMVGLGTAIYLIASSVKKPMAKGTLPSNSASSSLPASSSPPTPVAPAKPLVPATDEQVERISRDFAKALAGRDFNFCAHMFPMDENWDKWADDAGMKGAERQGFMNRVRTQPKFWQQIHTAAILTGGTYDYLHLVKRNGQTRGIIRLLSPATGLDYHEIIVNLNAAGEPKVTDIYLMSKGDTLNDSTRRLLMAIASTRDNSLGAKLTGTTHKAVLEDAKYLARMMENMNTSPAVALEAFNRISPELQNEKPMMLMKLVLTSAIGPVEYRATFEAIQAKYPGDPVIDLAGINFYESVNDIPKAVECVDRLDAYVGGDTKLTEIKTALRSPN